MDKEINDLLDEMRADMQRYEQQQRQQQDVDLDELMFEMNEFVDQYASVASPLSPGTYLLYIISLCFHCSKI